MFTRVVIAVAMLSLAVPVLAQEEEEQNGPWSGKVTFGYLATTGNTDNSSLNTGFEIGYAAGKWAHLLNGLAIFASESGVTTAEAYDLGWKSERNLTEQNFLFGRLDGRKDRFSSFESQFSQTVGYGRRILNKERHELSMEAGVGARQSELTDGSSNSETILRGGLKYKWTISETAEFTQEFTVEAGDQNTFSESVSTLAASLVGNLALVASYTIRHNSDVLPLTEKTDTRTALSLEYLF